MKHYNTHYTIYTIHYTDKVIQNKGHSKTTVDGSQVSEELNTL